jgi:tetratricopeptide (TPR) repeat protein
MSLDALRYERDTLMASLEDLEREHDRGELSDEDYSSLRDRYTVRAANVLRALDAVSPTVPPVATDPPAVSPEAGRAPVGSRRSRGRRWLAVVGASLVSVVVLIVVVTEIYSSSPSGPTSNTTLSPGVRQFVRQTLARAETLERQGKAAGALGLYQKVLGRDPAQEEALAESGWLEYEAGVQAKNTTALSKGQTEEESAERADPSAFAPYLYLGSMLLVEGDPTGAVAQYRSFLAHDPPTSSVRSAASFIDRAFQEAGLPPPAMPAGS